MVYDVVWPTPPRYHQAPTQYMEWEILEASYSGLKSVPDGHIECSRGMGAGWCIGLGTAGPLSEAGTRFAGHVPPDEPLNSLPLLLPSLTNLRPFTEHYTLANSAQDCLL